MADWPPGIIPHLTIRNAAAAIEFYKSALGFEELMRLAAPDGRIGHCTLKLGDQSIMLNDEFPDMGSGGCRSPRDLGGSSVTIHLYVADVDAVFAKAIAAGAKATLPVADMFWGDRYGKFTDPFGHHWGVATHKEDVSAEELKKRGDAMFSKFKKG
jgi:PhnB protein